MARRQQTIKMKNRIMLSVVFLLTIIISLPRAALAQQTALSGKDCPCCSRDDRRGTISVTGEAKEYYRPDTAIITLGVETKGATASGAAAENSRRAEQIIDALKALISPAAGDSIKTSSYSLQPVYEYDTQRKKNLLTGYMVRNLVTVKTKKTGSAGSIIDKAVESGANNVQGVGFTLSDRKELCDSTLKKAAERAKEEATRVARLLGTEISGVKSISSSCGSEGPRPLLYERALTAKSVPGAASETVIEPGDIALNAAVGVVFYLKEK
jgi:uncharacterized protein YggE